jgi:cyclomaltodextrinase / maltogenic alpha-amylase / neopullulanase
MIAMLQYWIKECDVDGFRCDVAWNVPKDFWEQVRDELSKTKPDIMMLAEADKPEFLVKAFDVDYSWSLLHTLNDVIINGAPASSIEGSCERTCAENPKGALHLRITDDHDETRAIARYGVKGALAASALMFTLDGVPLMYNGMEAGDATESGDPALFDKLTICWHPHQSDRPDLLKIYRGLIQLRENNPAFRTSDVQWLHNSNESNLLTYLRADDKDAFLVAINFSSRGLDGTVDLKDAAGFIPVKIPGLPNSQNNSLPSIHLNGYEWRIYHRNLNAVAQK